MTLLHGIVLVEALVILYLLYRARRKDIDMGTVTPHQRYWTDDHH